jgi:L-ribulose-5-phosphate 4-epimerase
MIAITPTNMMYDTMRPEDISIVDLDGKLVDAPRKPSSETPMHTAIFRHLPEVGAICHTHSAYAMAYASLGKDIPVVCLELYVCGAPIPVAPWAAPGTTDAGDVTVEIFLKRPELKICLLRNHGLVAIGKDLENAYELAFDAEVGMQTYHQASQVGQPIAIKEEYLPQSSYRRV